MSDPAARAGSFEQSRPAVEAMMKTLALVLLFSWPLEVWAQEVLTDEAPARPVRLDADWAVTDGSFRPVPLRVDPQLSVDAIGARVLLGRGVVLFGEALIAQRPGEGDVAGAAGRMGASVALGRHIVASGALLRELGGDMGG